MIVIEIDGVPAGALETRVPVCPSLTPGIAVELHTGGGTRYCGAVTVLDGEEAVICITDRIPARLARLAW